jgi:hypothetical protein
MKHVQQELDGLLLAKRNISTIKHQFSICITCYVSLKYNKISKLPRGTPVKK